ncbi:MAG: site-specific DNA-methyltransferase [Dehalococcoidia bacterium]|nr:MAG: site-specific DNA-methyltransferase [Dehalococcoidia bacterium]
MANNGVELVWEGKRKDVERVPLPFQRVEIINESRATRQASPLLRAGPQLPPDPLFGDAAGETPWRNKLIWGDNKYVLSSLIEGDPSIGLESLAGKVDLIYIDPPFATGADFAFSTQIGDAELDVRKEQSLLEEIAYRDTWGRGVASYLQMLWERLVLAHELLSQRGSIYVHVGPAVSACVGLLLDEAVGTAGASADIVWKRVTAHGDSKRWGIVHDAILWRTMSGDFTWNPQFEGYSSDYVDSKYTQTTADGRRYQLGDLTSPHPRPNMTYVWRGNQPPRFGWRFQLETMERLYAEGRIELPKKQGGRPRLRRFLDEMPGAPVGTVWSDIPPLNSQAAEDTGYDTQKPSALLERVIKTSSDEGALVLDFFCGSGTTAAVAETLGRRWIGCDLGRFAIHTSRKRLLGIEGCKPFEVLNLGRYERRYWQGINAGEAVYEYFQFIVKLYHAEPVVGFTNLHGRKGEAMVHVGATDAPVTIAEVRAAMEECKANGLKALDVLGWEWEMGLNSTGLLELQRQTGVTARLFHIPHEIMDKRAVAAGDVHFYEAAYVAAKTVVEQGRAARVELTDFLVAIDDYIREKVGDKVKKWSDWIDYWAVDFEYNGDIFHNQWQAYRTRREPKLELTSDAHTYTAAGKRTLLVKVVDIFGNDTTALLEVEV